MLEDCVTNLVVYDLNDARITEDTPGSLERMLFTLMLIAQNLETQNPLHLRLIYFDESVRNDSLVPEFIKDAIDEVLKACDKRKVDVAWTIIPSEINSDSFIDQDFWDRQKKTKGASQAEGAGRAGGSKTTE
jgi:hypothetical protein